MMQRIDQVLAMPPEQQVQEIDKFIDMMEQRRQSRDQAGERPERGDRGQDMTEAQRDQRRKERLDRISPEQRAKFDLMRDLVNTRREERGLEPSPGGPRFGPPGGGGPPR